ncbi:MAG: hypothetical protein OSB43_03060 [Nocardioides sp.]|jgi:hypothetical protein|uniref:hypothetical protein n=1 Tax=Nocardioides sp. TaxID=35761 RepID=UPI0023986F02|nr:hypothetical protein [Nocardioides sp.]MDE0775243.1 hypothetical protein [Nocardioides sp.]
MTGNHDPATRADEAQQALRALAHATRSIDPHQIYVLLGSLSPAVASLSQSLHQIAACHDSLHSRSVRVDGDPRGGRAAAHQVSWELHRAGEVLRHVGQAIDHAHEAEATIEYGHRNPATPIEIQRPSAERGLGL